MASVLAGSALGIFLWGQGAEPKLYGVLAAAVGLTLLGALDDAYTLSVLSRLTGQALAAILMVWTLPDGFQLFPGLAPPAIERILLVLGIIWFVNAVNFLDGLDWMTVVQVVPITLGVAALHVLGAVPATVALLALVLLGAVLGFAIFNKHPASIFLGDAGSLPIGLCLAFMLIFVAKSSLSAAVLLSLYTLGDASLTLLRRLAAGERVLSAHRSHFYQRAVAAGLSVPQVTTRIFLLGLVLAGMAIAAVVAKSLAADLVLVGLGVLATGLTLSALAKGR